LTNVTELPQKRGPPAKLFFLLFVVAAVRCFVLSNDTEVGDGSVASLSLK
jgi:hypothetical protein